jgi:hypothetical protein
MSGDHVVTLSQPPWYVSTARLLRFALMLFLMLTLGLLPFQVSTAQTSWQWYKTDLRVHSVISSEAFTDLGILSQSAKSLGYNAVSLTDHNLASDFPVSSLTVNNMVFDDSYTRWAGGYIIRWIRNGIQLATGSTAGASYETTKAIPLDGAGTYVRAEIRDADGRLKALTQPLIFVPVPADNYYIDHVITVDGRKYTKLFVKGITASNWNEATQALTLTLNNPANALVDMRVTTASAPPSIRTG